MAGSMQDFGDNSDLDQSDFFEVDEEENYEEDRRQQHEDAMANEGMADWTMEREAMKANFRK